MITLCFMNWELIMILDSRKFMKNFSRISRRRLESWWINNFNDLYDHFKKSVPYRRSFHILSHLKYFQSDWIERNRLRNGWSSKILELLEMCRQLVKHDVIEQNLLMTLSVYCKFKTFMDPFVNYHKLKFPDAPFPEKAADCPRKPFKVSCFPVPNTICLQEMFIRGQLWTFTMQVTKTSFLKPFLMKSAEGCQVFRTRTFRFNYWRRIHCKVWFIVPGGFYSSHFDATWKD